MLMPLCVYCGCEMFWSTAVLLYVFFMTVYACSAAIGVVLDAPLVNILSWVVPWSALYFWLLSPSFKQR